MSLYPIIDIIKILRYTKIKRQSVKLKYGLTFARDNLPG